MRRPFGAAAPADTGPDFDLAQFSSWNTVKISLGFVTDGGCSYAVNISSFGAICFHVIDSVWESESFVGLRNFILMAGIAKRKGPGQVGPALPIRVEFNLLKLLPTIDSESKQPHPQKNHRGGLGNRSMVPNRVMR